MGNEASPQEVSDRTLRDIAEAADRLEPPAHVAIHRLKVKERREVVAVTVEGGREMGPFVYEGRAYERVGSTTRRMPQAKYERLLIERGHAKRRWEKLPAEGLTLKDLDRKEILRTRELAIQQNRISPDTSRDIGEILDRLGLRVGGVLTHAAQVLYGKRFLPDYPQCLLKMRRLRGTEITGEIVDIVVFDDRIEIRSYGRLPTGIAVAQLSKKHDSKLVNPLIAGAFHRTGAVEVWGRGTNRVISARKKHGAKPPIFEENEGFVYVAFKAALVAGGQEEAVRRDQVAAQVTGQVTGQVAAQVLQFCQTPRKAGEIQASRNLRRRETFVDNSLRPLLESAYLERTIPDKPRSRLQRYRTTARGLAAIRQEELPEGR